MTKKRSIENLQTALFADAEIGDQWSMQNNAGNGTQMNDQHTKITLVSIAVILLCVSGCQNAESTSSNPDSSKSADTQRAGNESTLIQYGRMREVIGLKKSHGRIALVEATSRPHLYAVGALAGLTGEVTLIDGEVVATTVTEGHQLEPLELNHELQATLLVGSHISAWTDHTVSEAVPPQGFDAYIEQLANTQGIDLSSPFVFMVTGDFVDVRLHVIQGACPVHAKMHGIELSHDEKPFEASFSRRKGTLVGVFAKDAAGDLTHPDSSTHTHIIFNQSTSDSKLTAHVEQIGLAAGSVIRLPKPRIKE